MITAASWTDGHRIPCLRALLPKGSYLRSLLFTHGGHVWWELLNSDRSWTLREALSQLAWSDTRPNSSCQNQDPKGEIFDSNIHMFPQTSDCNIRIYSFFKQMPQHPMSLIQYISFFDCTLPCKLPNIRHKPSIVKKTSRSGDLYQQLLTRHILHCLYHNKTLPHSLCDPTKPIR